MKRASAIKVVLSCTGLAGEKKNKKNNSNFIFLNQLIKKRPYL
jgi:hypothetical protein